MITPILKRIKRLARYSFADLCVVAEAWWYFLKWHLLITYFPYAKWKPKLARLQLPRQDSQQPYSIAASDIQRVIRLSEIAGRHHIHHMNCLRRCLCQQQLLTRRGMVADMQIGVRFEKAELKAHAWLCCEGRVINDTADVSERYAVLEGVNEDSWSRFFR